MFSSRLASKIEYETKKRPSLLNQKDYLWTYKFITFGFFG
jgi:hypothetical protein